MKCLNEELLARYYDGELSDKQRRAVEAQLDSSDTDQESLKKMNRLGDLLRLMNEEQLLDVSFEGFEKRVLNGIQQSEKPGFAERVKVWMSEFFEHRKTIWIPAASFAGAAAAVLLVLPLLGKTPDVSISPHNVNQGVWTASANTTSAPGGSEVLLLSRNQTSGMEYNVTNDRGESIGVVWITD